MVDKKISAQKRAAIRRRKEERAARNRLIQLAKPLPRRVRNKYTEKPFKLKRICVCGPSKSTRTLASRRVQELSTPKYQRSKYVEPKFLKRACSCIAPHKMSSRMEEMALPLVRTLVSQKSLLNAKIEPKRMKNIDTKLDLSLKTTYSRLYHNERPEIPCKCPPSSGHWSRINSWLDVHARPKKLPSMESVFYKSHGDCIVDMDHIEKLAQPKQRLVSRPYEGPKTKVSDPIKPIKKSVLTFDITPRLLQLTTPFKPPVEDEPEMYQNPFDVPREFRKVTSKGVSALATPKPTRSRKRFVKGDNASLVFAVSPNALKAKPSAITKKLAEPKKNMQEGPRANPFAVSKAAVSKKPLPKEKALYYAKLATPIERAAAAPG